VIVGLVAGVVVVPDRSGQGEDALQDAGGDAGDGASVVVFEVELAFECVVDGLDDLPQRFEQRGSGAFGFAFTGRSEQPDGAFGEAVFELATEVVLVPDQRLMWSVGDQRRVDLEH
jgi:hypothetical protein